LNGPVPHHGRHNKHLERTRRERASFVELRERAAQAQRWPPHDSMTSEASIECRCSQGKLYSLGQIMLATFLGAPLAGSLLVAAKLSSAAEIESAWRAITCGLVSTILLLIVSLLLLERFPNSLLPVIYCIAMRQLLLPSRRGNRPPLFSGRCERFLAHHNSFWHRVTASALRFCLRRFHDVRRATVNGGQPALERTRHERASLLSCVGSPLKRSVRRLLLENNV
jgi:hypothetical protein